MQKIDLSVKLGLYADAILILLGEGPNSFLRFSLCMAWAHERNNRQIDFLHIFASLRTESRCHARPSMHILSCGRPKLARGGVLPGMPCRRQAECPGQTDCISAFWPAEGAS